MRISSEHRLGMLAMKFRGNRQEDERLKVAAEYAKVVKRLIKRKRPWEDIPAFEDQLPDEYMPREFFVYWGLNAE